MKTHTPGPWKHLTHTPTIIGRGRRLVARVVWKPMPDFLGASEETDEANANARLIAAAPDLLAACKGLASYVYSTTNPGDAPDALRAGIAAIAKAQGDA